MVWFPVGQQQPLAGCFGLKSNFNGLKSETAAGAGMHFSGARQAVCLCIKWRTSSPFDIATEAKGNWLIKPTSMLDIHFQII